MWETTRRGNAEQARNKKKRQAHKSIAQNRKQEAGGGPARARAVSVRFRRNHFRFRVVGPPGQLGSKSCLLPTTNGKFVPLVVGLSQNTPKPGLPVLAWKPGWQVIRLIRHDMTCGCGGAAACLSCGMQPANEPTCTHDGGCRHAMTGSSGEVIRSDGRNG